ncbi:CD209 antigen-like protein E [Clupea harengus]|uniref:CD209 antigen-like protein E n=1 Tax=Clupea harengus TaxID=7950 RepID=A0A6P8EZ43_CLUHA|nr:CD209 antigen-like protein E [Clupea harengus]
MSMDTLSGNSTILDDTFLDNKDAEEDVSIYKNTSNSTWSRIRMQILGIRHSGDFYYRVVTRTLGLLCVLLLTVILVMSVERSHLNSTFSNLTSERDLLKTNLKTLQEENNKVKSRNAYLEKHLQEGWTYFQSSLYYVSTEQKSWNEAREDCRKKGADLVIVNNRNEQEFLSDLQKEFWIGLTDHDGKWKWVDGRPLTDGFWDSGQPNSYGGNEDCVEIRPRKILTNWNDDLCSRSQLWSCEKKIP